MKVLLTAVGAVWCCSAFAATTLTLKSELSGKSIFCHSIGGFCAGITAMILVPILEYVEENKA
ncbi:MAG: hypothetical protein IKU95_01520 [Clostridia bacterium]|nr:hypothetical protein [Clostridia bacterium]